MPGSGRSSGGENGEPLWYSCLENPIDIETCQATVNGITESDTAERLSIQNDLIGKPRMG